MNGYKVTTLRPVDLTHTQLMRLIKLGYQPPLSVKVGRPELSLVPKTQEVKHV